MRRFSPLLVLAVCLLTVAFAAPASASTPPPAADRAELRVNVQVDAFAARGRDTTADATVIAQMRGGDGQVNTVRQKVTLAATTGGSCRILDLDLDELKLNLLGLNAQLSHVKLSVTGNAKGGVLGRLFCRLADTKTSGLTSRRALARSLNRSLARKPLRPIAFSAAILPTGVAPQAPVVGAAAGSAQAAQAAPNTCQVLNLIVGPLDLDLLGLIVKLNKIQLDVFAVRGQGILADRFCSLAS